MTGIIYTLEFINRNGLTASLGFERMEGKTVQETADYIARGNGAAFYHWSWTEEEIQ